MQVSPEQISFLKKFKKHLCNPLKTIQSAYKVAMVCTSDIKRYACLQANVSLSTLVTSQSEITWKLENFNSLIKIFEISHMYKNNR